MPLAANGGRDSDKKNRLERSSVPQENYLQSDFVALSPLKISDFATFSIQNHHFTAMKRLCRF
jgi:hypothetical protein